MRTLHFMTSPQELGELSEPHFHIAKEHNTFFALRILGSVTKISILQNPVSIDPA